MSPHLPPLRRHLTKKFSSFDSLKYELARLETFSDWPPHLSWLNPADLAANGFYYLKKKDLCACVFCRLIVGKWETGDTPSGEHRRHMPQCPFINGKAVGNIPMNQCKILDTMPLFGEDYPCAPPRCLIGDDYDDDDGVVVDDLNHLGIYRFKSAMRRNYITPQQRMDSFRTWPNRSSSCLTPKKMVEAGFFYVNLSDHVRCFHCGGGLRNWGENDQPWEEHARWYPHCRFVLLMKGQKFIDKVKPDVAPSSGRFKPLSECDLDELMKSDIVSAVINHGLPSILVRNVLRQKIKSTGIPFFSTVSCVAKVFENMEEEEEEEFDDDKKQTLLLLVEFQDLEITEFEQLYIVDEEESRVVDWESVSEPGESELDERLACKICMAAEFEIVFVPCDHISTCSSCTCVIKQCPICRADIEYFHKLIF